MRIGLSGSWPLTLVQHDSLNSPGWHALQNLGQQLPQIARRSWGNGAHPNRQRAQPHQPLEPVAAANCPDERRRAPSRIRIGCGEDPVASLGRPPEMKLLGRRAPKWCAGFSGVPTADALAVKAGDIDAAVAGANERPGSSPARSSTCHGPRLCPPTSGDGIHQPDVPPRRPRTGRSDGSAGRRPHGQGLREVMAVRTFVMNVLEAAIVLVSALVVRRWVNIGRDLIHLARKAGRGRR